MPQPLPQPFEVTPGPILSAMRMGQADRLAEQQRGALQQAGQLAAQGSLAGARKHLLGQGMLDEADKIGAMMRQAGNDQLVKAKRTYDVLGNLALTADTPEKWQTALAAAQKSGMDVSQYQDFGSRELVLAQADKVKEHLDYELKNRALDLKSTGSAGAMGIEAGKLSPGERWRMNGNQPVLDTTGRPIAEPIPGSSKEAVPAEVAARVGLADKFLKEAPLIRSEINQGDLGGIDFQLNRGKAASLYRKIEDGSEALVRNLTGAGMNAVEANAYAQRFLPGRFDMPSTKLDKLDNLTKALKAVRNRVMVGRGIAGIDDLNQAMHEKLNQSSLINDQNAASGANNDPLGILGP